MHHACGVQVPKPRNKTTKGPAAASVNGTVTTAQVEGQDASNGQGQGMLGKLRSIWNKLVHVSLVVLCRQVKENAWTPTRHHDLYC